ncbi:hypothetical protein IEQ34_013439 [Dendrobium chrysotoxum]|uniref:non-specific serine/threonine protein kinase n=1 Tax=Dendrobium chrysotoxum TaxID=161865 RepID=A0AAV7GQX3_DENCH|nr:hypothetical protein IEQ34_013439 [Dendrobium chrysotoxum]
MLVYEYMLNISLDAFLFDWNTMYNIIEGIARGLLYLHRDSRLRVIDRDLKANNILLDDSMNPRISYFGMAKIFANVRSKFGILVELFNDFQLKFLANSLNCSGYMSPEHAMQGPFSVKLNVYSFGILILEIVSRYKNNVYQHTDLYLKLIACAWKLWNEDNVMEFVGNYYSEVGGKKCGSYNAKTTYFCV